MARQRQRWIEVVGWNRFQHYKTRRPVWIKNYVALIHNDDYRSLTLSQRGLLHGLWMLYALTGGEIREDTAGLTRALSMRVTSTQLKALNDAGFIRVRASKPLAQRESRKRISKKKSEEPELLSFDEYLATKAKT